MSTDTAYDPTPGVKEAQQVVEYATAAEARAFAAVDEARELVALGQAPRGAITKAQRKLAAAMELRLDGEAKIRALRRSHEEAQKAEAAAREEERRGRVAELVVERRALEGEFAEFLNAFVHDLDQLILRGKDWAARARHAEPPYGTLGGSGSYPGNLDALIGSKSDIYGVKDGAFRAARDAERRV